jgi:hypothetical protein
MRMRTSTRKRSLRRSNVRSPGKVPAIPRNVPFKCVLEVARDSVNAEKDISQFIANFGYDE